MSMMYLQWRERRVDDMSSILDTVEILPKNMGDWIESLGPVEDIKDIEVIRDCAYYESDGGYRVCIPSDCLKVKVIIPPLEHCCIFVQCNGGLMRVGEYGHIVHDVRRKTVVEKQELNDNDAFDLMDSIRDELWK